jgi:hypothetical protein
MSISIAERSVRNVELHALESRIVTLYEQQKSDQEIAHELNIEAAQVKATRNSRALPPWRSASGRLFTPEVDMRLLELRESRGLSFQIIAETLGYPTIDLRVRYQILQRLEERPKPSPYRATIPCKLCGDTFVSEDRRKFRFCHPCKADVVPKLDSSPFEPHVAGGYISIADMN